MAMKIVTADCTVCGTCETECPIGAVKMKGGAYVIDPGVCTECAGIAKSPRCVAGCPADCIVAA